MLGLWRQKGCHLNVIFLFWICLSINFVFARPPSAWPRWSGCWAAPFAKLIQGNGLVRVVVMSGCGGFQ